MTADEQTTVQYAPSAQRPSFVFVPPSLLERNLLLLRLAIIAAYEDNCFGIAKGAAYSFLLSLFPVLTTLTYILIQVRAEAVVHVMAHFFQEVMPPGTEDLVLSRLSSRNTRMLSLPIVSLLLALWAGSGAMISLMEGFQAAYRIPKGRPFLQQRAMAIYLVFIAAVPAVAASSLILFGTRIQSAVLHSGATSELGAPLELAWRVGRYAVAFCTTTLVTGLLYYFGPNHRTEPERLNRAAGNRFWRVWPGAVLATSLWLLATGGFAWYVNHLAHYNIFYGSLGAVVVLTIWLYLIACIVLIGCEFNAEQERCNSLAPIS